MIRCLAILMLTGAVGAAEQLLAPIDPFALSPEIPAADRNPWPAEWEEAFRIRARDLVAQGEHPAPDAVWKSEKSGGGFFAFIKGRRAAAERSLRLQPPPPFADHTNGIDFYWCFHLEKQPRIHFQFGRFLGEDFQAQLRLGAQLWTAEDPRPNLELILLLDHPDAEISAHARRMVTAHWRSREQVREMIHDARTEEPGADAGNKHVFADYLERHLDRWPAEMPTDTAGWRSWWQLISDGDWKIYEEYERRVNPRPHPRHGLGTGPVGTSWGPEVRGGWVDWRNTDNLRGMREVAVYLFAEEAGNELVGRVYRERLRRTARGFLSLGNGEWDSPAYLGLTIQAYLMLYDFARDREVRHLAKGILDYLATTAALKYFRGGASGPNTRDYGTWASGSGGGASRAWSTWAPEPGDPVRDLSENLFLSAYRPPAAVVGLARREHALPCEVLASHPRYNNWVPGGDEAPAYHETQYRSRSFQMGSQVQGGTGDGNGGKIVVAHPQRGFDYIIPTSLESGNLCAGGNDRIAQCRNALLWLGAPRDAGVAWKLLVPPDAVIERRGEVVLLRCGEAWAAVRAVGGVLGPIDAQAIAAFQGKSKNRVDASGRPVPDSALPLLLTALGEPGRLTGFAIEMADALHFHDYQAFAAAVEAKQSLRAETLSAEFTAATGARVAMAWDGVAKLPEVRRDDQVHDWQAHCALWQAGSTGPSPLSLGWKTGVLDVAAGGYRFTGALDLTTGTYTWRETASP